MIKPWHVLVGIVVVSVTMWLLAGVLVPQNKGLAAPLAASSVVDIRLLPATPSAAKGASFTLDIQVEPNGQEVKGVDAFVNFNPSHLQVTSVVLSGTSPLNLELNNTFDNGQGTADFSAGKLSGAGPTTTFTLATITFQAQQVDVETSVALSSQFPRKTIASIAGEEVQRSLFGATVTIGTPPSPTPTPTPTPSATSTPTPAPTATPTPAPTSTPTPAPTATSTPVATAISTPVPTATPTPRPTATPTSTSTPSAVPGVSGPGMGLMAGLLVLSAFLLLALMSRAQKGRKA